MDTPLILFISIFLQQVVANKFEFNWFVRKEEKSMKFPMRNNFLSLLYLTKQVRTSTTIVSFITSFMTYVIIV